MMAPLHIPAQILGPSAIAPDRLLRRLAVEVFRIGLGVRAATMQKALHRNSFVDLTPDPFDLLDRSFRQRWGERGLIKINNGRQSTWRPFDIEQSLLPESDMFWGSDCLLGLKERA